MQLKNIILSLIASAALINALPAPILPAADGVVRREASPNPQIPAPPAPPALPAPPAPPAPALAPPPVSGLLGGLLDGLLGPLLGTSGPLGASGSPGGLLPSPPAAAA